MKRYLNAVWRHEQALPALALLTAASFAFGAAPARAHDGSLGNEAMWQACETKQINEPCTFQNASHDTYRGSCQRMVEQLVCVRNQPIELASATGHSHMAAETRPPTNTKSEQGWLIAILALLAAGVALFMVHRQTNGK